VNIRITSVVEPEPELEPEPVYSTFGSGSRLQVKLK
jgi:hypothetical protein